MILHYINELLVDREATRERELDGKTMNYLVLKQETEWEANQASKACKKLSQN